MNKKILIITGVLLMITGGFSALVAAFYEFKIKPEMTRRGTGAAPVISEKSSKVRPQGIGIDALMKHSKNVYGSDEAGRREGTLWVDREGGRLVVSLGILNGLKLSDPLAVYDHDQRIGQVRVESVFDVVSYVSGDDSFNEPMDKDYYRVEKE